MFTGRVSIGPWRVAALAAALWVAGCASGGGGGGGGSDLRGTVAAGVLLAGVPVAVVDASGLSTGATTGADGAFGFAGPFVYPVILKASPTPVGDLYGWALGPGTAHVTPLTTLALVVNTALPDDLAAVFAAWPGSGAAAVATDTMHAAEAVVNANLSTRMTTSGVDPATYDFATAPYPPEHTGIDAVLDGLDLAFDFGAGTYGLTDLGTGMPVPFDPNIDLGGYGVGGATPVGSYGAFTVLLDNVTLDGEVVTTTAFRPDAPAVGTVPGTPAASAYDFATESIGFLTPDGQALAQTFAATVDTADGATLRRIEYTLGLAGDPGSTITFALDCAGVAPPCGALVITPDTGGTDGAHTLLTTSTALTEEGAVGTPATATLIGTLRTTLASGGGGGGGGGPAPGTLSVGNSPPGLGDAFTPDSAFALTGAHWTRNLFDVKFTGFEGIAQQFLHVYFDEADPATLVAAPQYIVSYVATVSGTAPPTSIYQASCFPSCAAASLDITIDTSAHTVTFDDTNLSQAPGPPAATTDVTLNGTLSY